MQAVNGIRGSEVERGTLLFGANLKSYVTVAQFIFFLILRGLLYLTLETRSLKYVSISEATYVFLGQI